MQVEHDPIQCLSCGKSFRIYNNDYLLLQREWAAACSACRTPHLFLAWGESPVHLQVFRLRRKITLDEMQEYPFPWQVDPGGCVEGGFVKKTQSMFKSEKKKERFIHSMVRALRALMGKDPQKKVTGELNSGDRSG